jgi:hypothetical protein
MCTALVCWEAIAPRVADQRAVVWRPGCCLLLLLWGGWRKRFPFALHFHLFAAHTRLKLQKLQLRPVQLLAARPVLGNARQPQQIESASRPSAVALTVWILTAEKGANSLPV